MATSTNNPWCIACRLPMKSVSWDYLRCRTCGEWYARTRTLRRPCHISPDALSPKAALTTSKAKPSKVKPRKRIAIVSRNPCCLRCRSSMRRAGTHKNMKVFRCKECGCRATYGPRKRTVRVAEFVASCLACRRNLVTGGNSRKYLRCVSCGYLVKREGIKEGRVARQYLASCVSCRRPMTRSGYRDRVFFYCSRCHSAASAHCIRPPQLYDARLPQFVSAFVPRTLPSDIRQEVETEILLAILKTRRAGNGYGLTPKRLNSEVVQRFVKQAWRGHRYQHWEVSLDDSEHSLAERFAG